MQINVYNESLSVSPIPVRDMVLMLQAMALGANYKEEKLHVYLVSDAHIMAVNHAQLYCFGSSNILSFPPDTLMLSLNTLQRESLLYGQDQAEHMLRLFAHGLGHLLGYEHGEYMNIVCANMENAGRCFFT